MWPIIGTRPEIPSKKRLRLTWRSLNSDRQVRRFIEHMPTSKYSLTPEIQTPPQRVERRSWAVAVGYLDVPSDEMSQTLTDLSWPPLTIRFPSGLKQTLLTVPLCPLS